MFEDLTEVLISEFGRLNFDSEKLKAELVALRTELNIFKDSSASLEKRTTNLENQFDKFKSEVLR